MSFYDYSGKALVKQIQADSRDVQWTTTITGLRRAVVGAEIFTIKAHYSRRGSKSKTPGKLYRNGWMIWVKRDRQDEVAWKYANTVHLAERLVREYKANG